MTSSNGNIFRVTGHLCGEFTGEFPAQRPVTRRLDVFFDLRLNKRLSKQSWGWWFETLSHPLWRHSNAYKPHDLWLTYCVLLSLYGGIDRDALCCTLHQALTWTNVDLSSKMLCGIHLCNVIGSAHEPNLQYAFDDYIFKINNFFASHWNLNKMVFISQIFLSLKFVAKGRMIRYQH